jgi:hypothetical protein
MNHVGAEAYTSGRMISSGTISTPAEVILFISLDSSTNKEYPVGA